MSDTRLILGICPKCGKKLQIPAELHPVFLPVLRVVAACGGVASGADCDPHRFLRRRRLTITWLHICWPALPGIRTPFAI